MSASKEKTGVNDMRVDGTLEVTGNVTLEGNLTEQGIKVNSVTSLSGAGAIPITASIVKLTTTGADALTLADGVEGQELTIVMVTDGGDGTLTPSNFGNGTTATFGDAGDSLVLVFVNNAWYIKSNNGVVIA